MNRLPSEHLIRGKPCSVTWLVTFADMFRMQSIGDKPRFGKKAKSHAPLPSASGSSKLEAMTPGKKRKLSGGKSETTLVNQLDTSADTASMPSAPNGEPMTKRKRTRLSQGPRAMMGSLRVAGRSMMNLLDGGEVETARTPARKKGMSCSLYSISPTRGARRWYMGWTSADVQAVSSSVSAYSVLSSAPRSLTTVDSRLKVSVKWRPESAKDPTAGADKQLWQIRSLVLLKLPGWQSALPMSATLPRASRMPPRVVCRLPCPPKPPRPAERLHPPAGICPHARLSQTLASPVISLRSIAQRLRPNRSFPLRMPNRASTSARVRHL